MVQLPLIIENKDKKQSSVKFQVDGKILNELSKQVSSHLFALGELMKNSYDAEATSINITLDMKNNYLKIEDNGTGISEDNIKSLFHIAKSGKEYGRVFNFNLDKKTITRYTQGSKGLGLFCAFKFGDIVKWDTKYEDKPAYSITINKNNVIELSDITEINFPLVQSSRHERGTVITIALDPNDEEVDFIYDFFTNNNHSKKLVNFSMMRT
ncbi:ATP-binding protein [Acinetobacter courvalinii]|uniref:ATP-binding protein n=1 Tax=Acinetobacter courvalinii TaxID=280147 RepID=UPI00289811A8|nr:ATP-binding protein [Acinetobacter courvalinii]